MHKNIRKYKVKKDKELCPECSTRLVREGHCSYCPNCGWSICNV